MKRIAIIGAGISGLVVSRLLHPEFDIRLFEANDYLGGHTCTVPVDIQGERYWVDTGFVVHNRRAYPNFVRLLEELGVVTQPAPMTFSVRCERTGLEWGGGSVGSLFAQRRNALRPRFWRMIRDVLRFGREAGELLAPAGEEPSLGEYLESRGYSRAFIEHFLIPMGAAVWSTDPDDMFRFPARYFVRFFQNHGMLDIRRAPQWISIKGGARSYVAPLVEPFIDRIELNRPVRRLRRTDQGVALDLAGGESAVFDGAVVATHSDQALAMLDDPTPGELDVLGAIRYQSNDVALHTEASQMPRSKRAWSSWNYRIPTDPRRGATVTYYMNALQSLEAPVPILVSLNAAGPLDDGKVIRRLSYDHPLYTPETVAAQRRHGEISGARRVFFCGAYWGYGFHEDGVESAIAVARQVRDAARTSGRDDLNPERTEPLARHA